MLLASLRLQFGGDSGLQSCCQRVIHPGNKVASRPWERRENNQVLKAETLKSRVSSWQKPSSSFSVFVIVAMKKKMVGFTPTAMKWEPK